MSLNNKRKKDFSKVSNKDKIRLPKNNLKKLSKYIVACFTQIDNREE